MTAASCSHVVVFAAHPDDEILGCGGTLRRHTAQGDKVSIVFLADGVSSRVPGQVGADPALEARRRAARDAAALVGAEAPDFLNFSDQRLDEVGMLTLARSIEEIASRLQPDLVYTHHHGDLNLDHRLVCNAVLTAFRPMPGRRLRAVYGFEVLSSTEWRFGQPAEAFHPCRFIDIAAAWPAKDAALRAYRAEMRDFPHARSYKAAEAQAVLRGAQVGLEMAEAFTVYWEMIT